MGNGLFSRPLKKQASEEIDEDCIPVERRTIGAARAGEEREEERRRRRKVRLFKTLKSIKGNCSS